MIYIEKFINPEKPLLTKSINCTDEITNKLSQEKVESDWLENFLTNPFLFVNREELVNEFGSDNVKKYVLDFILRNGSIENVLIRKRYSGFSKKLANEIRLISDFSEEDMLLIAALFDPEYALFINHFNYNTINCSETIYQFIESNYQNIFLSSNEKQDLISSINNLGFDYDDRYQIAEDFFDNCNERGIVTTKKGKYNLVEFLDHFDLNGDYSFTYDGRDEYDKDYQFVCDCGEICDNLGSDEIGQCDDCGRWYKGAGLDVSHEEISDYLGEEEDEED